jgi:Ca2+-binding EF-hand superfamily protein
MRGDRSGDDSDNNRNNNSRRRSGGGNGGDDPALQAELLVPGFGSEAVLDQVLGFGPKAELMTVTVTDADRKEATETMARYDRNQNQYVDKDEITRRFAGNPLDFDRNQDGRLSLGELAVRYARRREAKSAQSSEQKSETKSNRGNRSDGEATDLFGGRRSYRSAGRSESTEGLPGYFSDRDRNGDGQISMAEFMQEAPEDWNDADVEKFFDTDFNQDGVITKTEALRNIEEGPASAMRAKLSGQASAINAGSAATGSPSGAAGNSDGPPISKKYSDLAKRIIRRYDKNDDAVLTFSEWKLMLMNPGAADSNRDGKITAEEYARWTISRGSGS